MVSKLLYALCIQHAGSKGPESPLAVEEPLGQVKHSRAGKCKLLLCLAAGRYTIFGHVIDGLEVLDKMERVPTGAADRPLQEIQIQRITIHANPLAT